MFSEWQVIGAGLGGGFLSGREGRCGSWCGLCWREGRHALGACRCNLRSNLTTDDVIGTDIVEPAPLILTCINIELDGQILSVLDIELLNTVFTEKVEDTPLGILARNL